ncbi:hypothetical protein OnM2_048070 [Erysiphe neolycopersici]|uniref:Uncharacterized protein n=1 Tax=Erysiphe neolycopersici TaxID=212602 RepID=A0A420HT89_9PEZI|nr:hypothetical protein OnM2_048070 [Erysiphe neolycopersici]
MEKELSRVQRGMPNLNSKDSIRGRIISASVQVPELQNCLTHPAATSEGVYTDIRAAIGQMNLTNPFENYMQDIGVDRINFTNRRYIEANHAPYRNNKFGNSIWKSKDGQGQYPDKTLWIITRQ